MNDEILTGATQNASDKPNWIVTGDGYCRRFEVMDDSVWKAYSLVKLYCDGRRLPMFVFGLDLTDKKRMEDQESMLTRALTRIRKDSALQEIDRDLLIKYGRWHRSLYRWVIDGQVERAGREFGSVGIKDLGGTAANG